MMRLVPQVMQKAVLYGVIAAIVVAGTVGIAFAAMSMNNSGEPAAANQQQPSDNNDVRVITHAMGETEITETPQRIVVVDWRYVEDVVALGIQPIGVADVERMKNQVGLGDYSLSADIADVGTRNEPNLETISELEPDLIIGEKFRHGQIYDQLSSIAPTLLFDSRGEDSPFTQLELIYQFHVAIADAVNRNDRGVANLDKFDAEIEDAKEKIVSAGLEGEKFIATGIAIADDSPRIRVFYESHKASQVLTEIGLENALEMPSDPAAQTTGFANVGLEAISTVDDSGVHFVYRHGADPDPLDLYKDNSVWTNLEFVKEGRVHSIGDAYVWGGIISTELYVDRVVEALTSG